jgi:hypothetical protein
MGMYDTRNIGGQRFYEAKLNQFLIQVQGHLIDLHNSQSGDLTVIF